MGLNRIVLMGRLTRAPELRHTQQGTSVASFTLAVDRPGQNKITDFIDIVAWKNTADFVASYFSKGRMAVVEGRLQIREWTDNNGNKRRNAEVVADNVYFGDSRRDDAGAPANSPAAPTPVQTYGNNFTEAAEHYGDDDLPF